MKVGILQTGPVHEAMEAASGDMPDQFARLLSGQGFQFLTWRVCDGAIPKEIRDADGWLITGSKHGVYEDHPWIAPLEDFLRAAFGARIPIVGVCFGHQILARALGGRVERAPGGWIVGRQTYDWGGEALALNAWHQDQVLAPPEAAEVIATGPGCPTAALAYGAHAFTVQAHPEYDATALKVLIDVRGPGVVPDARLRSAERTLGQPVANSELARRIGAFFRKAQNGQAVRQAS